MPRSPLKPRLKIKLKLPIVPASSTSNTATPVPEEQKVTPSRRAVAKRSAAVRGRRRIQGIFLLIVIYTYVVSVVQQIWNRLLPKLKPRTVNLNR